MRRTVAVWPVLLCVLILGPALGPGFVLTYDMVFVPDLALRGDFLGLGSALPRAVPSDAVVSVLDEVVPGMVLQKVALVAALLLGGYGAQRLVPRDSATAQLAATTFFMWNPYVAERLGMGHWPVLLAYGALPWVFDTARRLRHHERVLPALTLWLGLTSLSAFGGVMAAAVAAAGAADRSRAAWRRVGLVLLAAAAVNATWLVAGAVHGAGARTDPAGVAAFAARPEGELPLLLTLLGLGGVWNAEVVPPSRLGLAAPVMLAVWVVVCLVGVSGWARSLPRGGATSLVVLAATGLAVGLAGAWVPGLTETLVAEVPGGGLVRDGSRYVGLVAPAAASLFGVGAARLVGLVRRWGGGVALPGTVALSVVLAPALLLPDLGWGLAGKLRPVDYPSDYERARTVLVDRSGEVDGSVLVLPFIPYRLPEWNGSRRVIDPLGRYLTPDYLSSDDLYVGGDRIRGEDPRAREVQDLLGRTPEPDDLEAALGAAGIRWVTVDKEAAAALGPAAVVPEIGENLLSTRLLEVAELSGPVDEQRRGDATMVALAVAWITTAGALTGAAGIGAWRRLSRGRPRTRRLLLQ